MFGKVAKGLGGVVFGGEQDQISDDRAVESLLQRVADGVLSEDRREALEHLRDLLAESAKAQSAVGAMGFPILCEVVREERQDVELVRAALDCLTNAFTAPATGASAQPQEPQVVAVNAELFSRDKQNVPMLLSLLEEPPAGIDDFHCRYHALQILTGLSSSLHRLQEAVLAYPMGVVRLMDMMAQREVVRNEALLLMIVLAHGNAEVQKIAAFEGAFERLYSIIRDEGAADGGIIVQDCLQLTHSLLRKNASNQRMFRELGFVGQLPALLRLKQRGGTIAGQQAANLMCALETVRLLLAGDSGVIPSAPAAVDAEATTCQDAIMKSGVVDILIGAPIGDHAISSTAVRVKCLECLSALLTVSTAARDKLLLAATTVRGQNVAALFALLQSALHRPLPQERLAAEEVLAAFCRGNPTGQAQLASTLQPSSKSGPSFGAELLSALAQGASAGNGTARPAAAARILAHLLADCAPAKGYALAAQPPPAQQQNNGGATPTALLPTCCTQAAAAAAPGSPAGPAATALHGLLVVWCHTFEPAATALGSQAAHLQVLSGIVAGRLQPGDSVAAGLAAALLGVCLLGSSSGGGGAHFGATLGAIAAAGGAEAVLSALHRLHSSDAFQAAGADPKPLPPVTRSLLATMLALDDGGGLLRQGSAPGPAAPEPLLSPHMVAIVRQSLPLLEQQLPAAVAAQGAAPPPQLLTQPPGPQPSRPPPQWPQPPQQTAALAAGPAHQTAPAAPPGGELLQAQGTIRQLQGELAQLRMSSASGSQAAQQLQDDGRLAAAEARLAQAEAAAASLRQRLDQSSATADGLRAELQAAAAEAEAARSAAAKAEADMEDLANAFQGLEAHAGQLEAELQEARARAPSEPPGGRPPPPAGPQEVQRQIEAAVAAARAEAEAEAEENLNDLLACLGQEERKTERLSARLQELGENVDALLEEVMAEEDEDGADADEQDLT